MAKTRFTLTQYVDYIKPLFADDLNRLVLRQQKLIDKPVKPMPRHEENISAMRVGHIVDMLTRAQLLSEKTGKFPLRDVMYQMNGRAQQLSTNITLRKENELLDTLNGVNRDTVIGLNTVLHGMACWGAAKIPRVVRPNRKVVNNILHMVDISTAYLRQQFALEVGVSLSTTNYNKLYPTKVDYVTETALWDMTVSDYAPSESNLLKLIAYDILAFHTPAYKEREFMEVGIINPRLEYRYWLPCKQFPVDLYENLQYLLRNKNMGNLS